MSDNEGDGGGGAAAPTVAGLAAAFEVFKSNMQQDVTALQQRNRELTQELADARNREMRLATQLSAQEARSLPQLTEPATLASHVVMRDQHQYNADLRSCAETARVMIDALAPDDPAETPEYLHLQTAVQKMIKMIDLRLAAIKAAGESGLRQKAEVAQRYYYLLAGKLSETSGKWATGEKKFWEVQQDTLEDARKGVQRDFPDNPSFGKRSHTTAGPSTPLGSGQQRQQQQAGPQQRRRFGGGAGGGGGQAAVQPAANS